METKTAHAPAQNPVRRPWLTPEMRIMRAGSAEAGPNPVTPEGAFAVGS